MQCGNLSYAKGTGVIELEFSGDYIGALWEYWWVSLACIAMKTAFTSAAFIIPDKLARL